MYTNPFLPNLFGFRDLDRAFFGVFRKFKLFWQNKNFWKKMAVHDSPSLNQSCTPKKYIKIPVEKILRIVGNFLFGLFFKKTAFLGLYWFFLYFFIHHLIALNELYLNMQKLIYSGDNKKKYGKKTNFLKRNIQVFCL